MAKLPSGGLEDRLLVWTSRPLGGKGRFIGGASQTGFRNEIAFTGNFVFHWISPVLQRVFHLCLALQISEEGIKSLYSLSFKELFN